MQQTRLVHMGEMAAGVGHEINNPLTVSIGNLAMVKKELEKPDFNLNNVLNQLNKIEEGNERIRKIVNGLRIYSRTDEEDSDTISVNNVIEQTINFISEIYAKEGVAIVQNGCDQMLYTHGVFGKLQQALLNLVSNAKDATESQNERLINISLVSSKNNHIKLCVSDNGSGIPDGIKDKILNPFFTTKKIGKGTGMGLGLVNEIAKTMKGKLEIDSIVGEGSRFTLVLPSAPPPLGTVELTQNSSFVAPELLTGKALVVEDEAEIREIMVTILANIGIEADQADDGDTGLDLLAENSYDYIFTDMQMPRMAGDIFIREAQTFLEKPTKIFIVTVE